MGAFTATKGEKRSEFVFDSTAAIALGRFAAILDSLLTPRNETWHRLTVNNKELKNDRAVKLYFDEVNRTLFRYRYSPLANFSIQNHMVLKSIGAYGTGAIFSDQLDSEPGLRYKAIHLGEIFIDENHQGKVDRALRYFGMTARQAMQKFDQNLLPETIKAAAKQNSEQDFYFIHCVKPRQDYDSTRKDYKGMKFASFYVSVEGSVLLSEGGFTSFPYCVSRYEQGVGEKYGRSPAMEVLATNKTLQEMKKTMLKQGHRVVDPVLLGPDDGVLDGISLKAGAYNSGGVTSDGRPLVHALPTGRIDIGKDLMNEEKATINDSFLVSLFQLLIDTPQKTATEVLELAKEKGILLAPKLGGVESEYLGSIVERDIDLLSFQRLLPEMPGILKEAQGDYSVIYDSPLSQMQRAKEVTGLMRTLESTLQVVNVTGNPSLLDHFDFDTIMPDIAEIQAVPAKWMRALEDVQAIRMDRAKEMQTQQAIQAGPATAALVKAAGSVQK